VKLTDGKTIKAFQQYPPGSPLNPVSREELRKKFKKLASTVLPPNRIDEIVQTVEKFETLDDASKLVTVLSAP
jgi:2-methylcitrate dehydratase PrpD